jgi:hypothetical protein
LTEATINRRRGPDPLLEQILTGQREMEKNIRELHGGLVGLQHDAQAAVNQRAAMFARHDATDKAIARMVVMTEHNTEAIDKLDEALRSHMDGEADALAKGIKVAFAQIGLGDEEAVKNMHAAQTIGAAVRDIGKTMWGKVKHVIVVGLLALLVWVALKVDGVKQIVDAIR